MIRISITAAAFDAIAATLPFGSVGVVEREPDDNGGATGLAERVRRRLRAMRGPGESYSGVILRLAKTG